jgi:2-polyprenyl-3-methyl-5-hydroxy-6-metoxy-1,4-benzoquinol methylase
VSDGVTTKEYWDKYWGPGQAKYPSYDKSRGLFHSYALLLAECIARTAVTLGRAPRTLVDCGCGEGLILRFVREQQPQLEVTGIDYSDAIDKARAMGMELGYNFKLIRGDLFEVCRPGGAGPFDILISLGLIEHFTEPEKLLRQMTEIVAPGGCVITVVPNFDGLFNAFWKLYDSANYGFHVPISRSRLLEIHQQLGLQSAELFTMGTPTLPGIHDPDTRWEKALNWIVVQINGRILQRAWPRQASLSRRYGMTPAVACIGWKSAAP